MKIWTLMENTAAEGNFCAEHGLSFYIETKKHKILFDAGQTEAFAENSKKLGIDLNQVDVAVLSHGHYDHGGGLLRFLELNEKAPVYVSPGAFGEHYNGTKNISGFRTSWQTIPVSSKRICRRRARKRIGQVRGIIFVLTRN